MKMEYILYQAPINCPYAFMGFKFAMSHNWDVGDYVPVWRGKIEAQNINSALEKLFYIFNQDRPTQFCGRSLSVSDVVFLDGKPYYCDSFCWSECPSKAK